MKPRQRRMLFAGVALAVLSTVILLVLNAFNSNLVFFYTPSQVAAQEAPRGRPFRIGGLVEIGSVARTGVQVHFAITDNVKAVPVRYDGALPDLFKEGKGVVAQGTMSPDGAFIARQVLAKHDENYMPPEAAEALSQKMRGRSSGAVVAK